MPTLREARKAKRITSNEVAEHIGVTQRMYYYYEANPQTIRIDKAKAICDFLGYSLDEIFLSEDVK